MTSIDATLIKDGNSQAIRLTKAMLDMSGLSGSVRLDIRKGLIAIRPRTNRRSREGWKQQIAKDLAAHGPLCKADAYGDMGKEAAATLGDGLEKL